MIAFQSLLEGPTIRPAGANVWLLGDGEMRENEERNEGRTKGAEGEREQTSYADL